MGALIRNAAAQKANAKVMSRVTNAQRIVPRLRAASLLLLLLISLPFSLIGVLIMMATYGIRSLFSHEAAEAAPGPQQKTAIVTGQASSCIHWHSIAWPPSFCILSSRLQSQQARHRHTVPYQSFVRSQAADALSMVYSSKVSFHVHSVIWG